MKTFLSVAAIAASLFCGSFTLMSCGGGGGGSSNHTSSGAERDSAYCTPEDFFNANVKLQLYCVGSGYPVEIIATSSNKCNVTFVGAVTYTDVGVTYKINEETGEGEMTLNFSTSFPTNGTFTTPKAWSSYFAMYDPRELCKQGLEPDLYLELNKGARDSAFRGKHITYDLNYNQGMGMNIVPGYCNLNLSGLLISDVYCHPTYWGNYFMGSGSFTFIRLN